MATANRSTKLTPPQNSLLPRLAALLGSLLLLGASVLSALLLWLFAGTPAGARLGQDFAWLFAANTTQTTWFITRAAGFTGYLLLWLSTVWGLAVSSRILEGRLHGAYTYDFHQFISLLSLAFIALHVVVLMADQYLPFSLSQILVPFLSTYRPVWVGLGVLSLYLTLLVTVTFYLRGRIGSRAFRVIHVLSLVGYLGTAVHGLYAGTDSPLLAVRLMYAGTFLAVVFLTVYWVGLLIMKKRALRLA